MSEPSSFNTEKSPSVWARHKGLIAFVVVLVIALAGVFDRIYVRNALGKETVEAAIPAVAVIKAAQNVAGEELVLPGSVQAINAASIYARTSGFLKAWHTDIGAAVKKGQLLAEIDAPELDQQLSQAQADLATAQANYRLAQSTTARWQGLLATDSVSKQDADEKAGDAAAKKSIADSAAANVARLRELESFKRVTAPFDGTVVARNTDIGALINAGQGTELFRVADTRKLRIYAQVPQPYAASTKPGLAANLVFAEHPGTSYPAKIARTANAIDPTSRTLQVELEIDNGKGELLPGAYTEVHFKLPPNAESLRLPPTVILFRAAGLEVATVGADNRVTLKKIVQGRDFGSSIEVLAGVTVGDNIIMNPPDSITDGAQVHIVELPKEKAAAPQDHKDKAP